jgi:spermidine synthase
VASVEIDSTADRQRAPSAAEVALLASVFVIAACGLVYELAAGTLASYLLGDSVLQFSTIIGTYLFAMGVGSWLSRHIERQLAAQFLRIELLVGVVGGLMPAALFIAHALAPSPFRLLLYGLVLLVGVLVGLEIPLVMRLLRRQYQLKDLVSQVLTFDYLGALGVSIAFPLLLVPKLGLVRTALLFGLMNIAVAGWALWLFRGELRLLRGHAIATLACAGLLGAAFTQADRITAWAEDRYYADRVIHATSSPYQRIVVTQGRPGDDRSVRLWLNGNLQFHARDEYRYHEALVHPLLASLHPRRVLVLGGGDGMAVREVLRHDSVSAVTLVDLDPEVTRLFRTQPLLRRLNGDALHSPKLTLVNADAFQWLAERAADPQARAFDAIVIDFPDPSNYSLGKLYTTSFYQLIDQNLAASGQIVVQTTSPLHARKSYWTVVAGRRAWQPPAALPEGLRFIALDTLPGLFRFPPDMARVAAEPNRLSNQVLVQTFEQEWGAAASDY